MSHHTLPAHFSHPLTIPAWNNDYCSVCQTTVCFCHFCCIYSLGFYYKEELPLLPHLLICLFFPVWADVLYFLWWIIIYLTYVLFTEGLQKMFTKQPTAAGFPHSQKSMVMFQYPLFMQRTEIPLHPWISVHSQSNCGRPFHAGRHILERPSFWNRPNWPETGWSGLWGKARSLKNTRLGGPDSGSHREDSSCEKVLEGSSRGKHLGAEVQSFFFFFFNASFSLEHSCFQVCFKGKPSA